MNRKTKTLLTGIFAGALLGAAFAWIAADLDDDDDDEHGIAALGASDYFQLGISILTLARQFGGMLR